MLSPPNQGMKKAALKDCFVLYSIILINQNLTAAESFFPHNTPNIQNTQLKIIYELPTTYRLLSNKLNASRENVENVVKPPHTPVFKNKTVSLDISSRLLKIPTTKPIRTAPIIFVINVRTGNSALLVSDLSHTLPQHQQHRQVQQIQISFCLSYKFRY